MFKRILTATDGSDHAAKAVAIASDLAARHGANLTIVHVLNEQEPSEALRRYAAIEGGPGTDQPKRVHAIEATPQGPLPVPGSEQSAADLPAARQEIGKRVLDEAEASAREHGVSAVGSLLLEGEPAQRILDGAREQKADAIVLGSRGHGALERAIVGSVSHEVWKKADCLCITVN